MSFECDCAVLCQVMKRLMSLPCDFWLRFVNVDVDLQDNQLQSTAATSAPPEC